MPLQSPQNPRIEQIILEVRSALDTPKTRLFLKGVDDAIERHAFIDTPARSAPVSEPHMKSVRLPIFWFVGGVVIIGSTVNGDTSENAIGAGLGILVGAVCCGYGVLALLFWAASRLMYRSAPRAEDRSQHPLTPADRIEAVGQLLMGADVTGVAKKLGVDEASVRAWWEVGIDGGNQAVKHLS